MILIPKAVYTFKACPIKISVILAKLEQGITNMCGDKKSLSNENVKEQKLQISHFFNFRLNFMVTIFKECGTSSKIDTYQWDRV